MQARDIRIRMAIAVCSIFLSGACIVAPSIAQAQTLEELRATVGQKSEEIKKLEREAEEFRRAITEKQEEGKTLKAELLRIERAIGGLKRDVLITVGKIDRAELEMTALNIEIEEHQSAIQTEQQGLGVMVRALAEYEREPLVVSLLKHPKLSSFFSQLDQITYLKRAMLLSIGTLREAQQQLGAEIAGIEAKQSELIELRSTLDARRRAEESERNDRQQLLKLTRNQETEYQKLLKDREKRQKALEDEIREIEARILVTVDPSGLPPKRSGVLGPPLPDFSTASCWQKGADTTKNCVTQYFGYTSFARSGGYNGSGHNGADFRASIGTPVLAAAGGIVEATGDTDFVDRQNNTGCPGASYGKWILIRHPTNISTVYAHLASINVTAGQTVGKGDRIGLSGKSGYATGPHLHFTVFATQASELKSFPSRSCGRTLTVPAAHPDWYLDPLDYL